MKCCKQRWAWTRRDFFENKCNKFSVLVLNLQIYSLFKQKLGKGRRHYMKFQKSTERQILSYHIQKNKEIPEKTNDCTG